MPATAADVQVGLAAVSDDASTQLAKVAAQAYAAGWTASEIRAALFESAQILIPSHRSAAAELAVGWYDQQRSLASVSGVFHAQPHVREDADLIRATVAAATWPLSDQYMAGIEKAATEFAAELERSLDQSVAALQASAQKEIASGFRDTIIDNVRSDGAAIGWRRYARPGACGFCRMLADRGAVYRAETAKFAAHVNCHCLASPNFDHDAPQVGVEQYKASQKSHSAQDKRNLRDYLAKNFPETEERLARRAEKIDAARRAAADITGPR